MNEFERNAWCLLGIPIDVISYQPALEQVSSSAQTGQRCFFSTPNLNFIITALKEKFFRQSVIASDLVLLDGMPPVWMAKIIGISGIEKISGSNLFESLWEITPPDSRKLRVFLFGGEEGVAAEACDRINHLASGIECVGYYYPGFASVDVMSSDEIMELVNSASVDFVVVALGARKGQAWIMANRDRLKAPLISHLGAVVNFAANKIARAPAWMQVSGLEWIWRIGQEPLLWKRYLADGIALCELMILKIIPYAFWRGLHARELENKVPVGYSVIEDEQLTTIVLKGDCLHGTIAPLRDLFDQESRKCRPIELNLAEVGHIDGAFLGLCLLLYKQALERKFTLSFGNLSQAHQRVFNWNCVDYLL
jgi:N-acetylglucosaminyldiphosphoundecaprenol N-acetyl-beta-D-mannosaminyltransferase